MSAYSSEQLAALDAEAALAMGAVQAMMRVNAPEPVWCPHKPSERQQLFLDLDCPEAFYGGAAGGGKSDALLMAALQYVHVPGYAAILFRRTLTDLALPDSLIPRSFEWLKGRTPAVWHEKESLGVPGRTWTFPSGATLTFGYLDTEVDKYRYQSSAYQFVGFDEVTQFSESMYLYLFSRLRRLKGSDVPLRLRAASNPGGEGHEWAKARFIPEDYTKDQSAELKVWTKIFKDDEEKEITTQFVPSRITDNPALDQATYIEGLGKLDRITREQLLYGDWAISPTGRTYFNPDALALFHAMPGEIGELVLTENRLGEKRLVFQRRPDGMLSVWRTPVANRRYVMGCDAALGRDANRGEGKVDPDWSVVQVREQETGEQVARFRGRVSEAYFGEYWVRLHRWYNNAFVVPAVTGGYGRAALVSAMSTGLEAKYVYWREDETGMPGRRPTGAPDLGFTESVATRPVLYSLLDTAIIQHAIETYDAVTINEYYAFEINKDGKPCARSGMKDDCVSADALCVKGMQIAPRVIKPALGFNLPRRKYGGVQTGRDLEEERYWREQMKPTGPRLDRR